MTLMENYAILEKLGSGSMASIHKGIQKSLERYVAIKKIHPHLSGIDEFVQRFEREAKAAAGLSHVNIMDVIDIVKEGDDLFIVLEFIDGKDLSDLMEQPEKVPLGVVVSLVVQILNGLEHAHNKDVIHRDIKPANIIVTRDGMAKIADFGIAQSLRLPSVTQVGQIVGTPYYMSPEQAEGKQLDQRSDLFSVGVILYKLLTNQMPFTGDTLATVMKKVKQCAHRPIKELAPDITDELAAIVDKALAKDPVKRFYDAAEFAYALEDYAFSAGVPFGPRFVKEYLERTLFENVDLEGGTGPSTSQIGKFKPSTATVFANRPTGAILPLTGCFGCQVNLLDFHQSIEALRRELDVRYMYFMDEKEIPNVDIGIVEGCAANEENVERLKQLREKCKYLVALGTCACFGGIPGLRNLFDKDEIAKACYVDQIGAEKNSRVPDSRLVPKLNQRVMAVSDVVKTDVKIPGCPSPHKLILESIGSLLTGSEVRIPTKNLCHECVRERSELLTGTKKYVADKIRPVMELEKIDPRRCFLEQGILCMGIATREGCGARCLKNNVPCQGCMGPPLHIKEAGSKWINAAASLLPGGSLRFRHDLVGMVERFTLPVSMMPLTKSSSKKKNGGK